MAKQLTEPTEVVDAFINAVTSMDFDLETAAKFHDAGAS
jgi:limonene-1,2-epoxide hydrolase